MPSISMRTGDRLTLGDGCAILVDAAQDGRVRLVSLTEAGRSKVQDFHVIVEETERRFTASLSEQERGQLRKLLSRIIENLENEVNSV